jgi:hypothetical protein
MRIRTRSVAGGRTSCVPGRIATLTSRIRCPCERRSRCSGASRHRMKPHRREVPIRGEPLRYRHHLGSVAPCSASGSWAALPARTTSQRRWPGQLPWSRGPSSTLRSQTAGEEVMIGAAVAPLPLLRDRDAIFGTAFDTRVNNPGVWQLRIAARSPCQNRFAERWVGALRRELLAAQRGARAVDERLRDLLRAQRHLHAGRVVAAEGRRVERRSRKGAGSDVRSVGGLSSTPATCRHPHEPSARRHLRVEPWPPRSDGPPMRRAGASSR